MTLQVAGDHSLGHGFKHTRMVVWFQPLPWPSLTNSVRYLRVEHLLPSWSTRKLWISRLNTHTGNPNATGEKNPGFVHQQSSPGLVGLVGPLLSWSLNQLNQPRKKGQLIPRTTKMYQTDNQRNSQPQIVQDSAIWPNGIIFFRQPRFPWNKGISLTKLPFGGNRSCEVTIIWPEPSTVENLPWKQARLTRLIPINSRGNKIAWTLTWIIYFAACWIEGSWFSWLIK